MTTHHSHPIARLVTAGLVAGALAAPGAVAQPIADPQTSEPAPSDPPVVRTIDEGFDSLELLKRYTTVTMGPCQGRMCQLATIRQMAEDTGATVPPYMRAS